VQIAPGSGYENHVDPRAKRSRCTRIGSDRPPYERWRGEADNALALLRYRPQCADSTLSPFKLFAINTLVQ